MLNRNALDIAAPAAIPLTRRPPSTLLAVAEVGTEPGLVSEGRANEHTTRFLNKFDVR